jgi:hypothetical protein
MCFSGVVRICACGVLALAACAPAPPIRATPVPTPAPCDITPRTYYYSTDGRWVICPGDPPIVRSLIDRTADLPVALDASLPAVVEPLSWAPDDSMALFVARDRRAGVSTHLIAVTVDADGAGSMLSQQLLTTTVIVPLRLSWAPDGRQIAYSHDDRSIVISDLGLREQGRVSASVDGDRLMVRMWTERGLFYFLQSRTRSRNDAYRLFRLCEGQSMAMGAVHQADAERHLLISISRSELCDSVL